MNTTFDYGMPEPPKPGETVPCAVCGTPTLMLSTKRCNGCWEVEHRLDSYLRSAVGRRNMVQELMTAVEAEITAARRDTKQKIFIGLDTEEFWAEYVEKKDSSWYDFAKRVHAVLDKTFGRKKK